MTIWIDPCDYLSYYARKGDVGRLQTILATGLDANTRNVAGWTVLQRLAAEPSPQNVVCAQLLLQAHADPNAPDALGQTALHIAASSGQEAYIRLLLTYHARLNLPDSQGKTPLHIAASVGQVVCLEVLLSAGARTEMRDNEGCTAYDLAFQGDHERCLDCLASFMDRGILQQVEREDVYGA